MPLLHHAVGAGGVPHFAGLFAKKSPKATFLRRELVSPLGRDFTNQDVTWSHLGTDADDACLVQGPSGIFADVGNVARDLFWTQFGVASFDLVLFDVDPKRTCHPGPPSR